MARAAQEHAAKLSEELKATRARMSSLEQKLYSLQEEKGLLSRKSEDIENLNKSIRQENSIVQGDNQALRFELETMTTRMAELEATYQRTKELLDSTREVGTRYRLSTLIVLISSLFFLSIVGAQTKSC